MNRIDSIFENLRAEGKTALMPFLTAGYPSLEVTRQVIPALGESGASILEIGFPFSDPIADGPVIAGSMHEALMAGVTPRKIFDMISAIRSETSLGLVAMVSQSIVFRSGHDRFIGQAADAGFDGLIIPDLDVQQAGDIATIAQRHQLTLTLLVSQFSTPGRTRKLVEHCRGFIYLLARAGLTGEREEAPEIQDQVAALRKLTDLPIAAGFGISTPDHVQTVTRHADAAIVGSALVGRMGKAEDPVVEARKMVSELARGLSSHPTKE